MISILMDSDFKFEQDLRELLMAFYPGESFTYEEDEASLLSVYVRGGSLEIRKGGETLRGAELHFCGDRSSDKSVFKRAFYLMLSDITGEKLPWGTITGIRPLKLYENEFNKVRKSHEDGLSGDLKAEASDGSAEAVKTAEAAEKNAAAEGKDALEQKLIAETEEHMIRDYYISAEKLRLLTETAKRERAALSGRDIEGGFSLYVNIPFCPSTCLYCSFTSNPIDRFSDRIDEYIDGMRREFQILEASRKAGPGEELYSPISGKHLQTIYIGGGTPTALCAEDMDKLLTMIEEEADLGGLFEYTVEAGRPDSINRDKLRVLKKHHIDRISINPQTMNDRTLELIGRRHSAADVERAFLMAREEGFDNINMDVIMGLPKEDIGDVRYTLSKVEELRPESLTVHALAVKRAARLTTEGLAYAGLPRAGAEEASEMIRLGAECAERLGMKPYYLYRQKNMAGNQENVGYCLPGKENLYNILMMEEKHGVAGIGAGASTKLIVNNTDPALYGGNLHRVERHENMKNISIYLERIEEVLEKKRVFLASLK